MLYWMKNNRHEAITSLGIYLHNDRTRWAQKKKQVFLDRAPVFTAADISNINNIMKKKQIDLVTKHEKQIIC